MRFHRLALDMTPNPIERKSLNGATAVVAALGLLLTSSLASASTDHAQHLTWSHGLSQTTVFSIHEDQQGSVWFATEDGLNRFDGSTFTVYRNDPNNPASIPANLVRAVDAAPDGTIWAATEGGGVAAFDPVTRAFTRFRAKSDEPATALSSDYNRAILADHLGSVWVATRSSGLDRLDPASGLVTNYRHSSNASASLSDDEVYALLESHSGALFVGTDRGVDRYNAKNNNFEHLYLGGDVRKTRVRALYEDAAGVLWIGTKNAGLFSFDPITGSVSRFEHKADDESTLGDNHVQSILEDNFGNLWVGTASGLDLLDRVDGTFERYGAVDISATGGSGSVTSLHLDHRGSLWVGTELGGLIRWTGERAVFEDTGAVANIVTSFAEDSTGALFFGTVGEGLVKILDNGKVKRFKAGDKGSISDDRVMSLLRDSRGRLWVGTMRGGLNLFNDSASSFKSFRHDPLDSSSLSSDGIMTLHEDASGVLWIGTFGGGLNAYDGRNSFLAYRHDAGNPASLSSDRVTAILSTRSGLLWVGTDGGGLNLFNPKTGKARSFRHDPDDSGSLPADTICALFVDPFGTLWVGTRGGGLSKMVSGPTDTADPTFVSYGEADGLPNSVVYAIQPNGDGKLWLSTNHGLSLFDPAAISFTNFDASDGLQANEFNFGASYRSRTGKIYFGGINGYNAVPTATSLGSYGGSGLQVASY